MVKSNMNLEERFRKIMNFMIFLFTRKNTNLKRIDCEFSKQYIIYLTNQLPGSQWDARFMI